MANSYNVVARVFILDTPHASNLIKATHAAPHNLPKILRVSLRWVGGTTAGHTCVVTGANNQVCWAAIANVANFTEADPIIYYWDQDFKLTTLASGILYVYHHGELH